MSYETESLINQARTVFSQTENKTQSLEARLWQAEEKVRKLTTFMERAEPYIKAMELIDSPENKTP